MENENEQTPAQRPPNGPPGREVSDKAAYDRKIRSDAMRMWGLFLRLFREAAGIKKEDLAAHVGYSVHLVSSVERGYRMPGRTLIVQADKFVGAKGWLVEAAKHLSRRQYSSAASNYDEEEGRARSLLAYDTHVLHPLLRTEAYTRALLLAHRPVLADEAIDAQVKDECQRQDHMISGLDRVYSFIVEEWVLRRLTGGPMAMKDQLDRLLYVSALRHVSIQVLPLSQGAHSGLSGPILLLQDSTFSWEGHVDVHGIYQLIDAPERVASLLDRFTDLRSLALSPMESAHLIRRLAEEM